MFRLSSDQSHLQYKPVSSSKESLRHPYSTSVREITDIPDDYLNQSQVNKPLLYRPKNLYNNLVLKTIDQFNYFLKC